jgi:cation:H+ antiporter
MIFAVASFNHRRKTGEWLKTVVLQDEHAVQVLGLFAPIVYFLFIWWKGSLTLVDSVVLTAIYLLYLFVLNRTPAQEQEGAEDLDYVPRRVLALRPGVRGAAIVGLFLGGGLLLYVVIHPFVDSLKALALAGGVSEFVFIQWVAPFLSEFPEKVSAFKWASTVKQAPMALMNMVSSNINQWTVLAAMIPLVYSMSLGHVAAIPFDGMHRHEILLTILQSLLGMVVLLNMQFSALEALVIFVLWFVQFVFPHWREELLPVYALFIVWGMVEVLRGRRGIDAVRGFVSHWRTHVKPRRSGE